MSLTLDIPEEDDDISLFYSFNSPIFSPSPSRFAAIKILITTIIRNIGFQRSRTFLFLDELISSVFSVVFSSIIFSKKQCNYY